MSSAKWQPFSLIADMVNSFKPGGECARQWFGSLVRIMVRLLFGDDNVLIDSAIVPLGITIGEVWIKIFFFTNRHLQMASRKWCHCGTVTPYGIGDLVKTVSVNGLLPDGTNPCGWKVRLQCIAVRKECTLQTHLRILQRTPTHSYALPHFLLLKGTHSKRTPWLQTKIHALQTHSWNFMFSKKIMHSICTPET